MMQNHPKGIILGLALLIFSAVFGGENAELPNVKLTGAAVSEAKNMLSEESDKKAVLAMIKGNYAIFGKYGHIKEKRSGWMLRVVNREQFTNEPKKYIGSLEVLLPQKHLHGELDGTTMDYSNGWWNLETKQ